MSHAGQLAASAMRQVLDAFDDMYAERADALDDALWELRRAEDRLEEVTQEYLTGYAYYDDVLTWESVVAEKALKVEAARELAS